MKCPVCGAKCVCRKATEQCCPCHKHKARSAYSRLGRELAHGATQQYVQGGQLELFPSLRALFWRALEVDDLYEWLTKGGDQ